MTLSAKGPAVLSALLHSTRMANHATNEANHNAKDIQTLLAAFREERGELVARMERLEEAD